ncbi:hypothetical protein [Methylobacterium mesophilicum]|nr:hypothetical protein [Methylobacterium mesophilicum]
MSRTATTPRTASARDARRFARELGLVPKTTPRESPQNNGMAEVFV